MKDRTWAPLLGLLMISASAADTPGPDASKFARCAALAAADERLACYDQLARRMAPAPKPAPKGPVESTAPFSASSPSAAPAVASGAKPFGLTPHAVEDSGVPSSIRAVVSKIYEDRVNNMSILLDNGQQWAVNEAGAPIREGDAVTIKRASLASFLLVAPDHRSYRVRRLK